MTQKERMEKGLVYYCNDESILSDQALCLEKQYDYNLTRPLESKKREALLKEMFAEIGEGTYIEQALFNFNPIQWALDALSDSLVFAETPTV